jgi:hypothetical protein
MPKALSKRVKKKWRFSNDRVEFEIPNYMVKFQGFSLLQG